MPNVNGYEIRVAAGGLIADRDRAVNDVEGSQVLTQGAYTQTYSTTTRTVAAATATAVATDAATDTTPFGFATAEQADALVAAVNALIADNLVLRKLVNSLIDDLQAVGIAA